MYGSVCSIHLLFILFIFIMCMCLALIQCYYKNKDNYEFHMYYCILADLLSKTMHAEETLECNIKYTYTVQ